MVKDVEKLYKNVYYTFIADPDDRIKDLVGKYDMYCGPYVEECHGCNEKFYANPHGNPYIIGIECCGYIPKEEKIIKLCKICCAIYNKNRLYIIQSLMQMLNPFSIIYNLFYYFIFLFDKNEP